MTVWLLHLDLTPEEEARLRERDALPLPLGDVPDLTGIASQAGCRKLLRKLHPDEPPETFTRRLERLWHLYSGVQKEDLIAVKLPSRNALAIAEVNGPYRYETGPNGEDRHLIPVAWHKKPLRISSKKLREAFAPGPQAMTEITNAKARVAIRDTLPRPYNRFVRWKWLLVIFFVMGLIRSIEKVNHRLGLNLSLHHLPF